MQQNYSAQIRRVIDFIDRRPTAPCVLAVLAAMAILSVFHFSRRFRQEVGMSPCEYVRHRRTELAKAMLMECPSRPLADVALACGYSNQSHFTTAFKKATGQTPAAFRRAALQLCCLFLATREASPLLEFALVA